MTISSQSDWVVVILVLYHDGVKVLMVSKWRVTIQSIYVICFVWPNSVNWLHFSGVSFTQKPWKSVNISAKISEVTHL